MNFDWFQSFFDVSFDIHHEVGFDFFFKPKKITSEFLFGSLYLVVRRLYDLVYEESETKKLLKRLV